MDIRQLRYFVAIVEEGTISAAARKLHISQPPLSQQMSLLENEFNVTLFQRGARQITLTEPGTMLYRYATKILELEDAATDEMRSLSSGRKGTIRIGFVSSCDSSALYSNLRRFHEENPDVHFKVRDGNTYELLDLLGRGTIELALIRTPFLDNDLDVVHLQTAIIHAVGTTTAMQQLPDRALTVKDLAGVPLIVYKRWEKIIRSAFDKENTRPNIFCVCDDSRTCLAWAASDLGIALVPSSILHLYPNLAVQEMQEEELRTTICMVRKKGAVLTKSAEALYELIRDSKDGCEEQD